MDIFQLIIKKYWKIIILIILALIGIMNLIFKPFNKMTEYNHDVTTTIPVIDEIITEQLHEDIIVDIKGEVKQPGVYHMKAQDRVLNVIEKAGGLTEHANINTINLSSKVTDEMMVYIPNK